MFNFVSWSPGPRLTLEQGLAASARSRTTSQSKTRCCSRSERTSPALWGLNGVGGAEWEGSRGGRFNPGYIRRRGQETETEREQLSPTALGQETEVADAHEAWGEASRCSGPWKRSWP